MNLRTVPVKGKVKVICLFRNKKDKSKVQFRGFCLRDSEAEQKVP